MKGISEWIWIILSVVLGLFTLVFGSIFILRQSEVSQKQLILDQYSDLGTRMRDVCLKGGIGRVMYFSIAVPENTRAIYVANESDEAPPDKVSEDITKSHSHLGVYLCLQFFDENIPRCGIVGCDMKFTYIGTPSFKSTLQTIISTLSGQPPVNKFYLQINKTDYTLVQTIAVPIVGDVLPNITSTQTTSQTTSTHATTTTTTLTYEKNITGEIVFEDNASAMTPSTWNAHLPKLVTNGDWSYSIFTRYDATGSMENRVSWIYKKYKNGNEWQYTGKEFKNVHQPPGLVLDLDGNLHVFVSYLGSPLRFYDFIFKNRNPDGSINFDNYENYDEWSSDSYGYMGVGVNPKSGTVYTSLATTSNFVQTIFNVGSKNVQYYTVPKVGKSTLSLYPQFAFSPNGNMFYTENELISNWNLAGQYSDLGVYRIVDGHFNLIFSDHVDNPNAVDRWIFHSDMAFDSEGKLYVLYFKKPIVDGNCYYLLKEKSDGNLSQPIGIKCSSFTPPKGEKCAENSYVQLQIDSRNYIYLLDRNGNNLVLLRSKDDGNTWEQFVLTIPYLLPGTANLSNPTIIKPWSSPVGYNPDVIYGIFSGADSNFYNWYTTTFRIDLSEI